MITYTQAWFIASIMITNIHIATGHLLNGFIWLLFAIFTLFFVINERL